MINIIKKIITIINVLLIVFAFFFILYINVYNYFYLGKNPFGKDFFDFFSMLLPFIILLAIYFINFINDHQVVNDNMFYKIVTFITLILVIYIEYRSIFDRNMILNNLNDYHINFDYFINQIVTIKFMIYSLSFVNILFVVEGYLKKKKVFYVIN